MTIPGITKENSIPRKLLILLMISAAVRALIAGFFELGNDEVYYWTYAVYPGLSYFDHPPMVGWLIRIFTFNLQFQQEFFLRLSSIIAGTINTFLIYQIGKQIKDELTGWYSALLYTASIYGFVITGIFILPDTPQSVFSLMALLLMLKTLLPADFNPESNKRMIRIGILLGLGLLSKYTSIFLWAGMVMYILLYNRHWLKKASFYISTLVMLAFFSIVLVWNFQNEFISFTYQGERGLIRETVLNFDSFLSELGGEFLYNNPVFYILFVFSLIAAFRIPELKSNRAVKLLLLSGLPIILVFLILSLFRNTLPHWSGPGFVILVPLVALNIRRLGNKSESLIPGYIKLALGMLILVLSVSILQIETGWLYEGKESAKYGKGEQDYSLEIVGWKQLGTQFGNLATKYEEKGEISKAAPIISYRWFPAANLEYYVARPSARAVLAAGSLDAIHNYAWINRIQGGFRLNSDAWYITSSRDFRPPSDLPGVYFAKVSAADTIPIKRLGKTAYYFYVYRLMNLQSKPADPLSR